MLCSGVYKTKIQVSRVVVDGSPAGTSAGNRDVGDEGLGKIDFVPGVLSTPNYDTGSVGVEKEQGKGVG